MRSMRSSWSRTSPLLVLLALGAAAYAWTSRAPSTEPSLEATRTTRAPHRRAHALRDRAAMPSEEAPANETMERAFAATASGLQAVSPTTGLDAVVQADGTLRIRHGATTDVRMHLARAGRGDAGAEPPSRVWVEGGRARIARGAIEEWYQQTTRGLEQGFDLRSRPPGSGAVVLGLALEGARAIARGAEAVLVDASGREALSFHGLVVVDARGRELPSSIRVHEGALALAFDDTDAAYPVRVDPFVSPLAATLSAATLDLAIGTQCGLAVAVRNGIVAVGCPGMIGPNLETNAGAVLLFLEQSQSGGTVTYTPLQKLYAGTPVSGARFGASLVYDGTRLVVGAPAEPMGSFTEVGHAYVFERNGVGGTFVQTADLGAGDPSNGLRLGADVSIDGDLVLAGAPGGSPGALNVNTGTAYLFDLGLSAPYFVTEFGAPSGVAADEFGASVAIDAPYVLVGAPAREVGGIDNAGAVFGYALDGSGNPVFVAEVGNPTPVTNAGFGAAAAISVNSAVVGCPRCNTPRGNGTGSAVVYTVTTAGAVEQTRLIAPDGTAGDFFGRSVAIEGGLVLVGAPGTAVAINVTRIGAGYVFLAHGGTYIPASKLLPSDALTGDAIGFSVACDLSKRRLVVGAPTDGIASTTLTSGSARVFGLPDYAFVDVTVSGSGSGNVVSVPDGIACPTDCTDVYATGASVTLTATPASGSYLASVSGGCNASPCQLSLTSDRSVDVVFETKKGNGTPCGAGLECVSGLCVDGVCCGTTCGGGVDDCQACSVDAGGTADGSCTPLAADVAPNHECRVSLGLCDPAEFCDANSTACPANLLAEAGTVCRDGGNAVCNPAETCNGSSVECPADVIAPADTPCADTLLCNGTETCDANGLCVSHAAPTCQDDGNPCTVDLCVDPIGCISVHQPGCVVVDGGVIFLDAGIGLDGSVDGSTDGGGDGAVVPPQPDFQGQGGCSCEVAGERSPAGSGAALLAPLGLLATAWARRRSRRKTALSRGR